MVRALHSAVVPSALMAVDGGGGGGLSAGGPRLAGEAELMRIDFPARGRWRADGRAEIMPAGRAIESCKTAAAARASRSVKLIAAVKKKTQVR